MKPDMSYKDKLTYSELQARIATAAQRLADEHDVTLTPLHPIDHGDWCAHCRALSATVENRDTNDRYCDALCAVADEDIKAEAAERATAVVYAEVR